MSDTNQNQDSSLTHGELTFLFADEKVEHLSVLPSPSSNQNHSEELILEDSTG